MTGHGGSLRNKPEVYLLGPALGGLQSQSQGGAGPSCPGTVQAPGLPWRRLGSNFVEKVKQRPGRKGQKATEPELIPSSAKMVLLSKSQSASL